MHKKIKSNLYLFCEDSLCACLAGAEQGHLWLPEQHVLPNSFDVSCLVCGPNSSLHCCAMSNKACIHNCTPHPLLHTLIFQPYTRFPHLLTSKLCWSKLCSLLQSGWHLLRKPSPSRKPGNKLSALQTITARKSSENKKIHASHAYTRTVGTHNTLSQEENRPNTCS